MVEVRNCIRAIFTVALLTHLNVVLVFLRLPILRIELRCSASVSSVQSQITKNTKRDERYILFALLRDDMADILTYLKSTRFTAYQS